MAIATDRMSAAGASDASASDVRPSRTTVDPALLQRVLRERRDVPADRQLDDLATRQRPGVGFGNDLKALH